MRIGRHQRAVSRIYRYVKRIWTRVFRWLLRLDVVQFDTVVEEYIRRNREALSQRRREWVRVSSERNLSESGA
jgi:hypothetical protein